MTAESGGYVALGSDRYERLLDAAETYRETLVVRLCGEVGLRPAELTRLSFAAVERVLERPPRYLLAVRESAGEERIAYLPADVERELRRYVRDRNLAADEPIFDVTARRLQMIVSEVSNRASERFDEPALASVSSSDLRGFFARTALVTDEVNPRVVKAVGGWRSFEALEPHLPEPTEAEIVAAFDARERRSAIGFDGAHRGGPGPAEGGGAGGRSLGPTGRMGRDAVARRHRAVVEALLEATDRDGVEDGVCEALTRGDVYEFGWIDGPTRAGPHDEWRTARGIDPEAIDDLRPLESPSDDASLGWSGTDLGGAADGTTGSSAGDDRSFDLADAEDSTTVVAVDGEEFEGAVATVELGYRDATYGTLSVATDRPEAFDDVERRWLETTGRVVGYAIAAVRRQTLLLADTVVELVFQCRDERSFFVRTSAALSCQFALDSIVPLSKTTRLLYVELRGASPSAVFELADDDPAIDDWRLLETYEDGWRVEFVVEGAAPALTVMEYGATVLETVTEDGVSRITAECAVDADVRTIVDGLTTAYPDSRLLRKRDVERPVQTAREFREELADRLTARQEAALRAAYFGGYYDWPRESTAEELADSMGVSSPTLHNHLRKAQHELLRTFFDDG